jgi:hypothetical protein
MPYCEIAVMRLICPRDAGGCLIITVLLSTFEKENQRAHTLGAHRVLYHVNSSCSLLEGTQSCTGCIRNRQHKKIKGPLEIAGVIFL